MDQDTEDMKNAYKILGLETRKEETHNRDVGGDWNIILKMDI